jgi:Ferritin-like domain
MDAGSLPTRRELLGRGVGAGMAAAAGMAWLDSADALAATTVGAPATEPERMARLLSVEMLSVYIYDHVISSSLLSAASRRALVPLRDNDRAHAEAWRERLKRAGGVAPSAPGSVAQANRALAHRKVGGRLGQLKGAKDALFLLLGVERVTVGAYFVALAKLRTRSLMTLSAEIMANDAQHEALIGELLYPKRPGVAVPYGLVQGVQ